MFVPNLRAPLPSLSAAASPARQNHQLHTTPCTILRTPKKLGGVPFRPLCSCFFVPVESDTCIVLASLRREEAQCILKLQRSFRLEVRISRYSLPLPLPLPKSQLTQKKKQPPRRAGRDGLRCSEEPRTAVRFRQERVVEDRIPRGEGWLRRRERGRHHLPHGRQHSP